MKNGIEKYYIYLFVGLVPWIFFSSSITSGASSVMQSKDMVKKIYFPREILPISCVTSGFVNMLYSFIVIFAVLIIARVGVNFIALPFLIPVMIVEYILSLGFALLAAGLTVYFRDLEYILGIITMAWMYVTPVLYDISIVPEKLKWILYLNPMTPIIVAYRDILYYKQIPEMSTLLQALIIGVISVVVGYVAFRRLQRGFAEEL
jgi:ABC-2 type transport system permease protein